MKNAYVETNGERLFDGRSRRNCYMHFVLMLVSMLVITGMCSQSTAETDENVDPEVFAYQQQIMDNACCLLTSKRPQNYKTISAYITWINTQKLYYSSMMENAELYSEEYNFVSDWSTAAIDIGISALNGDISEVGEEVLNQYLNYAINELDKYVSFELTTEKFIYSQAWSGINNLRVESIRDIGDRMEDGKFTNITDAIDFIMLYQGNEACLAAAEMGRMYYYEQINIPWYEHLGKLTVDYLTSQLRGIFLESPLSKFTAGQITNWAKDLFALLNDYYDNEFVKDWKTTLDDLEEETEQLLRYSGTLVGEIKPSYLVLFDPNGGKVGTRQRFYTFGKAYGYLPIAYRFGYDFLGWYDDDGTLFTNDTVCRQNDEITLHAKWSRIILSSGECGPNLSYILYGDGLLDISGYGEMTSSGWSDYVRRIDEVSFPENLTSICDRAFYGSFYLHEINIPTAVVTIGTEAFAYSGLQQLDLPANLQCIGIRFLEGTSVKEIFIPGTVTTLEWKLRPYYGDGDNYGVFYKSGLEKITFGSGIINIPLYTCYKAEELKEIILPDTLLSIGASAFELTALESLELPEDIQALGESMLAGNKKITSIFIPKTVTSGTLVFSGSEVRDVTLEDGIETIPDGFFKNCKLTELLIPNSVISIGQEAFSNSGIQYLDLPSNLRSIGIRFLEGTSVKEISIPGTVTKFESKLRPSYGDGDDYGVFYNSGLEKITFEYGIIDIPMYTCYKSTELKKVILPDTLLSIGASAFELTALESLELPEGVQTLGRSMLSGNKAIVTIFIPKTITSGLLAFSGSEVCDVTLEEGIQTIPEGLFRNSKITEILIPDSVISIGQEAFAYSDLQHLDLPSNLQSIGIRFLEGTSVKEIYVPGSVTQFESDSRSYCGVFYDCGLEKITFGSGVTDISSCTCYNARKLKTVVLPDTIKKIGFYAFGRTALSSITITKGVDEIHESAFSGNPDDFIIYGWSNSRAEEYAIASGITFIPLDNISLLPSALSVVEESAFEGNSSSVIIISEGITEIRARAFAGNDELYMIKIYSKDVYIADDAFADCPNLILQGYKNSSVYSFAVNHNIPFKEIEN